MSVLIKGMEIPKTCLDCSMQDGEFCCCTITGNNTWDMTKQRDADCPLVELPPHGRLIDADALDSSATDYSGNHLVYLVDIDDAPTIIEAEEGE